MRSFDTCTSGGDLLPITHGTVAVLAREMSGHLRLVDTGNGRALSILTSAAGGLASI